MNDSAQALDRGYDSIAAGDEVCFSRVIGAADVAAFAALTGDRNPLHVDDAYAETTQFGRRVVHGMLVGSFFSTLVGMHLPGRRALLLSQDLQFASPVSVGERITFSARVRKKTDAFRVLDLETLATNDAGEVKVRGRAQVKVLS